MKVIDPQTVTDTMLVASSVAEDDYPEWSAAATYAAGTRVIVAALHRIFESVSGSNTGNDPATTAPAKWIEVSATNRWAMFDEAVGSATTAIDQIVVTLAPANITTLSVLDVDGASVRARVIDGMSVLYDTVLAIDVPTGKTVALFADLPQVAGAQLEVTAVAPTAGSTVAIGTLVIGEPIDLGLTEAGPTVGINDYSRRETDDFGVTSVIERAWAKRMSIRSLISTDTADEVQRRLAMLRARACLWIGEDGYDSLVIYGFFKEFAIDLALPNISYCTLTIEGLTTAGALDNSSFGISVVFSNGATQPSPPIFGSGTEPVGWSLSPVELSAGEYRWWSQANFRGGTQLTDWTTPVKVGGWNWADLIDDDPAHPKPADGATVGATPEQAEIIAQTVTDLQATGAALLNQILTTDQLAQLLDARTLDGGQEVIAKLLQEVTDRTDGQNALISLVDLIGAKNLDGSAFVLNSAAVKLDDGSLLAATVQQLGVTTAALNASIELLNQIVVAPDGAVNLKALWALDNNGYVSGIYQTNDGSVSAIGFLTDNFFIIDPNDGNPLQVFQAAGGVIKMPSIEVDTFKAGSVDTATLALFATGKSDYVRLLSPVAVAQGATSTVLSLTFTKQDDDSYIRISGFLPTTSVNDVRYEATLKRGGTTLSTYKVDIVGDNSFPTAATSPILWIDTGLPAGTYTYVIEANNFGTGSTGAVTFTTSTLMEIEERKLR